MRPEFRNTQRWLNCRLTEEEILERARTMSERLKERNKVEAEKKAAMNEYGLSLKKLGGEIDRLSETISTGEEKRPIECVEHFDQERKEYTLMRKDTHETIERRPLESYEIEKQEGLQFPEGEDPHEGQTEAMAEREDDPSEDAGLPLPETETEVKDED